MRSRGQTIDVYLNDHGAGPLPGDSSTYRTHRVPTYRSFYSQELELQHMNWGMQVTLKSSYFQVKGRQYSSKQSSK